MNTTLKPRMKPMEFSITLPRRRDSWVFSSSTPAPEISETYPGTSGRTQGERNETSPARNAAMGRGRVDIGIYCTCCRKRALINTVAAKSHVATAAPTWSLPTFSFTSRCAGNPKVTAICLCCQEATEQASAESLLAAKPLPYGGTPAGWRQSTPYDRHVAEL